jgi:hypothetical protein
MQEGKNVLILVLAILVIIGVGYLYWHNTQKYYQIRSEGPEIIEAWFYPPVPVFAEETSDYRTNLNLRFEPTSTPLLLNVRIHFKNRNGEGTYQDTVDVSEWADTGAIYRIRSFGLPGEYTLTATLKNDQGETSIDLPTLVIN